MPICSLGDRQPAVTVVWPCLGFLFASIDQPTAGAGNIIRQKHDHRFAGCDTGHCGQGELVKCDRCKFHRFVPFSC